jgi:hypothetical protein
MSLSVPCPVEQEAGIPLRHIASPLAEQDGKVEYHHRIAKEASWSRATFDGFASAFYAVRT